MSWGWCSRVWLIWGELRANVTWGFRVLERMRLLRNYLRSDAPEPTLSLWAWAYCDRAWARLAACRSMALLERKLVVGVTGEAGESCGRCEEGVGIADRWMLLWDSLENCPERFSVLPVVEGDLTQPVRLPPTDKVPGEATPTHPPRCCWCYQRSSDGSGGRGPGRSMEYEQHQGHTQARVVLLLRQEGMWEQAKAKHQQWIKCLPYIYH